MKIKIKFFFYLSLLFVIGFSCKTSKVDKASAKNDKALLWEISGKGLSKPSYVFGTIHMIPAEDYFLPKGTLTAIENSEKMFFEIDMKDMTDMSSLMGIMNKIFMKDGLTLKSLLSESDYKKVGDYFKDMGLPLFMLERIKPLFLSAFAMADMAPNDLKEDKIKSYEMEFYEIAKNRKMSTGGLETIDFQISVFDSIPYADQAKMLMESINSSSTDNSEMKEMVAKYVSQDIEGMAEMVKGDDMGKHEDILLTGRNKNWIPKISEAVKKQSCFFAVGAGHLGGPNGVVNLLRKEGYRLSPVIEK